jgi:hypothetical protein
VYRPISVYGLGRGMPVLIYKWLDTDVRWPKLSIEIWSIHWRFHLTSLTFLTVTNHPWYRLPVLMKVSLALIACCIDYPLCCIHQSRAGSATWYSTHINGFNNCTFWSLIVVITL